MNHNDKMQLREKNFPSIIQQKYAGEGEDTIVHTYETYESSVRSTHVSLSHLLSTIFIISCHVIAAVQEFHVTNRSQSLREPP